MPKISVIMSVYNGGKYLKQAINSVLNQTYRNLEYIIIDDGSTDNSLQILKEFKAKDQRILVISRENKGLIPSLNEGVKLAQGEYIARIDADDVSLPERFEKQLKWIEERSLVICGTWADGVDSLGVKVQDMNYPPVDKIRFFVLRHNPFIHSSVVFRKDVFEKVGGYKSFFRHIEDYELWTRIVFKYKTGNIPEKLLLYRFHDGQITKKNNFEMRLKGILVRILAVYRFIFRF